MIIFLHGADAFRAREKLEELKCRFLEKNGSKEYLISSINEDNFNIAEFRNKVLSAGFFTEKKLIILDFRFKILDFQKEILETIKKIPEETILIIWETGETEKKSELEKFLLKQKFVFEFNPLSGNALVSWVRERAKNYACEIDNEAIAEIRGILGNDLWKIDLELSKLCAYVSECHSPSPCHSDPARDAGEESRDPSGLRPQDDKQTKRPSITKKIVNELLIREAEDNIFGFIDALAAKNKRLAMLSLEEEFRAGVSELQILGVVSGQIRNLIQTKALLGMQAVSKEELAKKIGVHPYVAQKSLSQARNFQMNELKNIYRQLLAIDMGIKTSSASPRAMFGRMIAKI